jgi:CRISPR-associated endonuclease/helicase Cas3
VTEWLHGRAEWEPPRTSVAWRSEVAWLTGEHLGQETLDDLLADYPLRSRETLSDVTARVSRHLARVAERDRDGLQRAWLLHPDRPAEMLRLADLVRSYDPKRNPSLEGATVVLAPAAGGLQGEGLLDGAAAFDPVVPYDLGPRDGERVVLEVPGQVSPPAGMRLVRAVRRTLDDADEPAWWQLHAKPRAADDDGSRSSRTELLLDVHLRRTEAWASRLAERLALDPLQRQAFAVAARVHDLGKRRQVWQRSIKRYIEPPLAKGPMQPAELGHYRHELGSLHDGDFGALDPDGRDLALHVVAAHHGRARPHFPAHECYDPELPTDVVSALVREVPLRFDRLQTRYGRWGLAWLESILRAADVLGSEDEEAEE